MATQYATRYPCTTTSPCHTLTGLSKCLPLWLEGFSSLKLTFDDLGLSRCRVFQFNIGSPQAWPTRPLDYGRLGMLDDCGITPGFFGCHCWCWVLLAMCLSNWVPLGLMDNRVLPWVEEGLPLREPQECLSADRAVALTGWLVRQYTSCAFPEMWMLQLSQRQWLPGTSCLVMGGLGAGGLIVDGTGAYAEPVVRIAQPCPSVPPLGGK